MGTLYHMIAILALSNLSRAAFEQIQT